MNDITYNKTFNEWQQELDTELVKSAESFVRIGYLLKVARDTDILKDSGYENLQEFAQKRYGLDKTQVSRFIHINDRFSVNGNSEELQDKYKGFGYAKLTVMLQLPDEINEELTPDFSKSEVEDIKKEIDEEKKISDIEVWMEGTQEEIKEYNELGQAMYQLLHDTPELFTKIADSSIDTEELMNILAPSGEMIYSVRIPGTGRLMLSIKTSTGRITITNVRSMEKTEWNMEDLAEFIIDILSRADTEDSAKAWSNIYKEEYPKKTEVAPVQPEKAAQRKEKKVQKAKIEKPKPQPVEESKEEEQIPGQDSVLNHPEYLPENDKNVDEPTENITELAEVPTNAINTSYEEISGCERDRDKVAAEDIEECWDVISDANRKIGLFIEDFRNGPTNINSFNIECASINAATICKELDNLKHLLAL